MNKQKAATYIISASIICMLAFSGFMLYRYGMPWLGGMGGEQMETAHNEQVTLHFIYYNDFPKEIFTRFTKEHPDIRIEFQQFGRQHYPDVQQVRLSSGENVDLMEVMPNDYRDFAHNGYLADITGRSWLEGYSRDAMGDMLEEADGGRLYAVPYKSSTLGIWYNKILFNKYGVKAPDTYEKLLEACRMFRHNGVAPMVIGGKDEWRSSYLYYLGIGNNVPEVTKGLQGLNRSVEEVGEFIRKGYLLEDSINLTNRQAFNEFARGRAAMFLTDDSSLDMIEPGTEKVCDLGVFPIPGLVPGIRADFRIGIFKDSVHKAEAELFLEYISRPQVAQYYVNETKSNSTIGNVNYSEVKYNELWEPLRKSPLLEPMASSMKHDVNKRLNRMTRELLAGLKTPRELLKEME